MTQDKLNISRDKKNRQPEPAAIIGLSCLFPGAENLAAYWAAIKNRRDAIGDIPPDHWQTADYYDPDPKAEDKTYGRRGGFLAPVDFEPLKYGIVPNDISAIDTTQILGLVAADRALTDAGYLAGGKYNHCRTAVMLGVTGALKMVVSLGSRLTHPQLRRALADSGVDPETAGEVLQRFSAEFTPWQESSFPGLLGNVTAGRIANRLNLGGANLVTDAACASSLAALRQSFMELNSGQADLVVTGGLDTFSDPFMYTCFSKTPALSPTGDVRAYDRDGDGTMLGEGIGIVVLKRLADARRDGDRIYAIVRSIGSASDGKGAAIFAPSADGQVRALNNTYETAGISPAAVGLIEGHGTGTAVGDTVEVEALNRVFRQSMPAESCRPWCAIGSVKSQIGHTKAAAGVAGVIKAALSLYQKVLPPVAKVENPLPLLVAPGSPFYLTTRPRPWLSAGPRRAGVSAFGFGGSNFHALLEEDSPYKPAAERPDFFDVFTFSGAHPADVAASLAKVAKAEDLAGAAARSRATFFPAQPCRLILVAGESFQAMTQETLRVLTKPNFNEADLLDGVFFGHGPATQTAYGYLRPGAAHVRQGLFSELAIDWPPMLEALNKEAAELAKLAPELPPLDFCLYPPDLASPDCRRIWTEAFDDNRVRRASARALTSGLEKILDLFGLKASAIVENFTGPDSLVQNLNKNSQVRLWLELAPLGNLALAVREAGFEILSFDGGRGSGRDLAHLLARLAAAGQNINFKAWPVPAITDAVSDKAGRSFAMKISGANQFVRPKMPPARPMTAASAPISVSALAQTAPAAPAKSDALSVLETMTAETMRLHQDFLTQQTEALKLIRQTLGNDSPRPDAPAQATAVIAAPVMVQTPVMAATVAAAPVAKPQPAAQTGQSVADLVLKVVAEETGYPVEMLNLDMDLESDLGLDSIKKVEIMATLSDKLPDVQDLGAAVLNSAVTLGELVKLVEPAETFTAAPVIAPASAPAPASVPTAAPAASQSPDVWQMLKEVVAAETGYPPAMLKPEMSLGDDLGLDSIKLVEISSIMAEKIPEATPLTADALNGAATLGQLAAFFNCTTTTAAASSASQGSPEPVATPVVPPSQNNVPDGNRVETILEIVAKETGYPRNMLNLSMHLEGDLGLDSIKKVEIMAAISERLPELEALSTADVMAGLETLGDLANLAGDAAAPQTAAGPVAAKVSAPAAAPLQAENLLLDVVATETGYPREMLNFEASLEADLGLDSIKRVEIMAALSEKAGDDNLAASSADVISQAQTLGDLRDILAQSLPGTDTSPVHSPGVSKAKTPAIAVDAALKQSAPKRKPGRPPKNSPPLFKEAAPVEPPVMTQTTSVTPFQVEMVPAPMTTGGLSALNAAQWQHILIVADSDVLSDQLKKMFTSGPDQSVTAASWADAAAKEAADPKLDALILVWPGDANDLALGRQAFQILKAAGPAFLAGPGKGRAPLLMGLTFMGGQFGLGDCGLLPAPASAALPGLLKSVAREWPGVKVRAMDFPQSAHTDLMDFLPGLAAACGADAPVETGMPAKDKLTTPRLVPYKLKNIRVRHMREGQTLLVTGGARGVTAATLKELAKSFRPRLVIMGRTPLTPGEEPRWLRDKTDAAAIRQALFERAGQNKPGPRELASQSTRILAEREIKANLAALERTGAKVTYISGNFMDADALNAALGNIKKTYGPIYGFIHGAGVLADGLLVDKSDEDFDLVFDTKARLARNILEQLEGEPLNLVAFFSSSTARFGRRGQSDYAAGNEVLNKMASAMAAARQGAKFLSVNWGPWAGGMVNEALSRLFENEGIGLIPLDEGARLFAALAGAPKNDPVEVVVLGPQTDLSSL